MNSTYLLSSYFMDSVFRKVNDFKVKGIYNCNVNLRAYVLDIKYEFIPEIVKFITSYPNGWNWENIYNNPSLPYDYNHTSRLINKKYIKPSLEQIHRNYNINTYWDGVKISSRNDITVDFIVDNPHVPWIWDIISKNPIVKFSDIINNPTLPWYWPHLSANIDINIDFIKNNLNKKWDWKLLSSNPYISMKDITDNLDLPWDWKYVSLNPNISIDFVKNNSDKNWDWRNISENSAITPFIIEINTDMPWRWQRFSSNPNLTFEFYEKYKNFNIRESIFPNSIGNFNIGKISKNTFGY